MPRIAGRFSAIVHRPESRRRCACCHHRMTWTPL